MTAFESVKRVTVKITLLPILDAGVALLIALFVPSQASSSDVIALLDTVIQVMPSPLVNVIRQSPSMFVGIGDMLDGPHAEEATKVKRARIKIVFSMIFSFRSVKLPTQSYQEEVMTKQEILGRILIDLSFRSDEFCYAVAEALGVVGELRKQDCHHPPRQLELPKTISLLPPNVQK